MIAYRIFDRAPSNWTDLQEMVGQLFEETGCTVEIGKTVPNIRGAKEIDVYVRDESITPNAVYLCECKYWERSVPQEIVHAFRTVMADTGAHRGYIISKAGFQSGAYESAANTNIDLLTFAELQEVFDDRWRIAMGEKLAPYTDIFFSILGSDWRSNAYIQMGKRTYRTPGEVDRGLSAYAHAASVLRQAAI